MRSGDRYVVEGLRARAWGVECDVVNASSGGFFLASPSPPPIGQALTPELALDPAGHRARAERQSRHLDVRFAERHQLGCVIVRAL